MAHTRRFTARSALLLALALPIAAICARQIEAQAPDPSQQKPVMADAKSAEFFEARIRPILSANCFECHADKESGGLRLDSREAMIKGGDSGPALVPGDA